MVLSNNSKRDYLQEYVEIIENWKSRGITIDSAPKADILKIKKADNNAIIHTGLNRSELVLIAQCRLYKNEDLFRCVNTYFFNALWQLKSKLASEE